MPWRAAPDVDFEHQPEYQWDYWKVGCQEKDLFGELHRRFNVMPTPTFIQDPDAFHRDVAEIARQASNKDDFFSRMQERRDQRLNELLDLRNKLWYFLGCGYSGMNTDQLFHLTRFNNFASLDTILAFWASLLSPNKHGKEPSMDDFLCIDELRRRRESNLRLEGAKASETATQKESPPADSKRPLMPTPPRQSPAARINARRANQSPSIAAYPQQTQASNKRKASLPSPAGRQRHDKRRRTEFDEPQAPTAGTVPGGGGTAFDSSPGINAQAADDKLGMDNHGGSEVLAMASKRERRATISAERVSADALKSNPVGTLRPHAPRRSRRIADRGNG